MIALMANGIPMPGMNDSPLTMKGNVPSFRVVSLMLLFQLTDHQGDWAARQSVHSRASSPPAPRRRSVL
jgi:hypothetical protein